MRAPTPEEIAAVESLLVKVKNISVKDAAGKAGLALIADGKAIIDTLNSSTKGVKAVKAA